MLCRNQLILGELFCLIQSVRVVKGVKNYSTHNEPLYYLTVPTNEVLPNSCNFQETMEETGSESASGDHEKTMKRRRYNRKRISVVNPDENFYFHWLMVLTFCILYNLWTLIVRQSFPELQVYLIGFNETFAFISLINIFSG